MPYVVHQYDVMVSGFAGNDDATNLQEKLNTWEKQGYNLVAVVSQFKNTTERAAIHTPAMGLMPESSFPPIDGPLFILHKSD